jgi:hypothetical protein
MFEELTKEELKLFNSLDTPKKIQDYLNKLKANLVKGGRRYRDTCFSPRKVIQNKKAHCVEGAIFAAAVLRYHNFPALIVDLESTESDLDHVIAVFKKNHKWGAISKTNHAVLRYREPVYSNIRELVMSYFHEYTDTKGNKTLRAFSPPVNLKRFDKYRWIFSEEDVWYIPEYLTKVKHYNILNKSQIEGLRKADKIEIKVGDMKEYKK